MSTHLALGAVGALAGLAVLGSRRGSRARRWAYHATREVNLPKISRLGLEPRRPFGMPHQPVGLYFTPTRESASHWNAVVMRFPWPDRWDEDPYGAKIWVDDDLVSTAMWTTQRVSPSTIEVQRDGRWVPLLHATGSRAILLQQLPPGFIGRHSEDAEDSGLDLVVELRPALRAAVEVIEDLYGEGWRDLDGKVNPRHLLREAGLVANDRVVVISFIEVPPLQRGMGLGTEGVERIERWARSQGAKGILLRSGQTGQPSWAHPAGFWKHMGYYELHLHDDPVEADDEDAILFKSAERFAT
jgi:GNAT superfamily N-acetyltransferase